MPGSGGREESLNAAFLAVTAGGLAAGGLLRLIGQPNAGDATWLASTVVALGPGLLWVAQSLRRRQVGVDLIAVLALAGTLVAREYLAGAVIAFMVASGRALEARAAAVAHRELSQLVSRTPRVVHRHEGDQLVTVDVEVVVPGDILLVRPGEIVPVDGLVASPLAVIDESALTGEPLPVEHPPEEAIRSGTVNAGGPFDLQATTTAADSTYASLVRLVEQARATSAPFVRMADRYAAFFLPVSLAAAAVAWAASGSFLRAVAVLVVATPCPLIIAAPVAIVAGMSQSARRGLIVKGGGPLEALARARVLLFDKTGTVTEGRPRVIGISTAPETDSSAVLRLAASLDRVSSHVLAAAVVQAATARGLTLSMPTGVEEAPGLGITGQVAGHRVAVGKADWLLGRGPNGTADSSATGGRVLTERPTWPAWVRAARRRADIDDALTAFVEIDGETVGVLLFNDPIRADAARTVRALRASGIERLVMVTGDRWDTAETIGAALGVDEVLAERTPTDKVDAVRLESRRGPTVMVGDGINDAPALAVAGIGVAVSARGATASSEAADAVLTVDRLDRVADAVVIARRSRMIARQSVLAGMGLSLTAMAVAALGWLPPAIGAALQEAIDVSVILNALRARMTPPGRTRLQGEEADLARRFRSQHDELRGIVARVRDVADSIGVASPYQLLGSVRSLHEELSGQLLPHEMAEDAELYPVIAGVLGGVDPTGPMSRAHVEIAHTIRRLGRFLDGREADTIDEVDLVELRRILYGLYALLELHFAQEDEGYFSMVEEGDSEQLAAGVLPEH